MTAETPVDRELEVNDSSRMVSHASSTGVTNVENVQAEVVPVEVLLAIAWVDPYPSEGRCFQVRALLDQESTLSFISESLSQTPQSPLSTPTAQRAAFGWIIFSPMGLAPRNTDIAQVSHCIDNDTNSLLHKFWENEKIHQPLPLTDEDK